MNGIKDFPRVEHNLKTMKAGEESGKCERHLLKRLYRQTGEQPCVGSLTDLVRATGQCIEF